MLPAASRQLPAASYTVTVPSPIESLRSDFLTALAEASTESQLKALRDQYLGRKGGAIAA